MPGSRVCRHWTEAELWKMRRLAATHTQEDAAKILGRTLPGVAMKAKAEGISFRKWSEKHRNCKHSAELVERVRQENERGKGTRKIAKEYRIPLATVQGWCSYKTRTNEPVVLSLS